ncbi:DUF1273 domain-containing protein [Streptococcus dentiloxodontae]
MTSLLVTGYKSFELAIFKDNDPRIAIIKKAIKRDLLRYLNEGLEWLVLTGNLGFEYWTLEVAKSLQDDYGFQIATIFPFETHGKNWNEENKEKLAAFKQVDFVKYTFSEYYSPNQFRQFNQFLIDNTSQAYLFYDPENETHLKYFYDMIMEKENYPLRCLTFEDLNEIISE